MSAENTQTPRDRDGCPNDVETLKAEWRQSHRIRSRYEADLLQAKSELAAARTRLVNALATPGVTTVSPGPAGAAQVLLDAHARLAAADVVVDEDVWRGHRQPGDGGAARIGSRLCVG